MGKTSTWPTPYHRPNPAELELTALLAELTSAEQPPTGGPCADEDPELFWPISDNQERQIAKAKTVCAGCPVLAECREFGMTQPEGIWGGTTATERREIRAQAERHRAELERLSQVDRSADIVAEVA